MSGLSRKWRCRSCGYIYDETLGFPEEGIEPGTPFETIPEEIFYCPDCGTEKQDFELIDY